MSAVALRIASRDMGAFYVPQFEVRIEGVGLPRDVLRDVIQLTYDDHHERLDGFSLTVNNWDPATNDFKYIGARGETEAVLKEDTPEARRYRLFEPSRKAVEVRVGYGDAEGGLRTMLTGSVTTLEPSFPSGGGPTLTVRGLNILHQLRTKPYTEQWSDKKDSEVARAMARARDKRTRRRRFPIPIVTNADAERVEPELEHLAQKNEYDIDFLFRRARERGYVLFIKEPDLKARRREPRLYFGPSQGRVPGLRAVTYELKWGQSLIDFTPSLSTAHQVESVTVVGWNRRTRSKIEETVTLQDPRFDRNRDLFRLVQWEHREDVVVREPVFTPKQARERAFAILSDRLKGLVTVTATTVGLPDLRAGQLVRIADVGARLSGTYFVTATTHTIDDGGYTTRLTARREQGSQGVGR